MLHCIVRNEALKMCINEPKKKIRENIKWKKFLVHIELLAVGKTRYIFSACNEMLLKIMEKDE